MGPSHPIWLPPLAKEVELGWRLGRRWWDQGYATEAAAEARDEAIATLGPPRLISIVNPANVASQRVAAKLGMTVADRVPNPFLGKEVEVWAVKHVKRRG